MKNMALVVGLALLFAYLGWYPTPIAPESWSPAGDPNGRAPFLANNRLDSAALVTIPGNGPEDVAIDETGAVFTGLNDGRILKIDADGNAVEFANTGGRPLGLKFDRRGNLIVADAFAGLLRIDPSGQIEALTREYKGRELAFVDDLDIADNGVIYFSDASRFTYHQQVEYALESGPTGSLYAYDPRSATTTLVKSDMYFPNGVALAARGDYVLVAETLRYRITKVWVKGPRRGESEVFMDNLPGFPDGIARGANKDFWVAFAAPRSGTLDAVLPYPWIREVMYRLPRFLSPKPQDVGFFVRVSEAGEVLETYQSPSGYFAHVTNVVEVGDTLYLGSLKQDAIAILPL